MNRRRAIFGGGVLLLAVLGTWLASASPDGLDRVSEDLGFKEREQVVFQAPLADYAIPALPPSVSGAGAGLIGTLLVGALAWGVGRVLARPRPRRV